jgi:uncharacterized membrane protein YccC
MAEILIATLAGCLIGLAISLVVFPINSRREIEQERLQANIQLYHEILLKKQDHTYKYSPTIRKIVNLVHANLLLQQQNNLSHQSTHKANSRYEPSL